MNIKIFFTLALFTTLCSLYAFPLDDFASDRKKPLLGREIVFKDRFTQLPIEVAITNEISSDAELDSIIYFKHKNYYYKRVYKNLTPEMFGAKGDGVSDDYKAIQMMLDKGELGCTFYFDGNKTYYNAFANDKKWREPLKRNVWQRHRSAKFLFNGAKLRRRLPEWNDKNLKGNHNEGQFYTDDHTALLYLSGDNYIIDGANFNSNVMLGNLLDGDEKPTGNWDYAVGTCMEMGLWLEKCKNVTITNSTFSNSVFPIYIRYSEKIKMKDIRLSYAAQASKRIHSKDQALGGGVKLQNCKDVEMSGIFGFRNLNDTVEIESYNSNIKVEGKSELDYSNSLVIIYSDNVEITNWTAKNVTSGSGVLIRGGDPLKQTKNISGNITVDSTSWAGVLVWLLKDAKNSIDNVKLNIKTSNTGYTGLFLNNESQSQLIKGLNLNHNSTRDGIATGNARIFNNSLEGICTGNTYDAIVGVKAKGNNSKKSMRVNLNVGKGFRSKYDIDGSTQLLTK